MDIVELGESITTLLRLKRSSRERRTAFPLNNHGAPAQPEIHQASTTDKPLPVLRSISYIRNNLSAELTLERLALEAHVSKHHFCRLFKRHLKMTPMEYISYLRIQRAKELLLREDLNITMVALEVGYNDASTFIRHFKKVTNLTPSDYKKSFRKISSQPHE